MNFTKFHDDINLSNHSFLITGGAGFIGSNLVEYLVQYGAGKIRIIDNFSSGNIENIREFLSLSNVELIEGDIRSYDTCLKITEGIEYVSHQAALGSVPRSIDLPLITSDVNISGFLNVLTAAKEQKVQRFVYAASSSTYGDSEVLPRREDIIGKPMSPYAVSKYVNELYAGVYSGIYGFHSIGLRYFNVFGPKQNPSGRYAAVIPLFIKSIQNNESPVLNGTGEISRDFTFVSNVVQANIKSLFKPNLDTHSVYNIACGQKITLTKLINEINLILGKDVKPLFSEYRSGDVLHSVADISKARIDLGYEPEILFEKGVEETIAYLNNHY